jgi:hypothetical protein
VNLFIGIVAIVALGVAIPATTLQRDMHDDTIYVVRGGADQLVRFENDVGLGWKGGRLLKKENGTYYYWAYPDRTAPQARELMFGAMASGLTLDVQDYDQNSWFPAARTTLDNIAISCGFRKDPFFVTPAGDLQVVFDGHGSPKAIECARQKVKIVKLPSISKRSQ